MYVFIPNRLEVLDHPGIDVLPLNILFVKSKEQDGKVITGSALYSPDMSTLQVNAQRIALTYRNPMDDSWIVVIEYDTECKSWEGTKSASGKDIAFSSGTTWEGFFKQLTMIGLQNGEPCAFLDFPEMPPLANFLGAPAEGDVPPSAKS